MTTENPFRVVQIHAQLNTFISKFNNQQVAVNAQSNRLSTVVHVLGEELQPKMPSSV
jgi:hypothetical protein